MFKWDRERIESLMENVFEKVNKQKVKWIFRSSNSTKIWKGCWGCSYMGSPRFKATQPLIHLRKRLELNYSALKNYVMDFKSTLNNSINLDVPIK